MQVHANAPWTPRRRRELVPQIDTGELTVEDVAELAGVSTRCVYRWLARLRAGDLSLEDRSSAPRRRPHAVPADQVALIEQLRRQRWTVPAIAEALKMATSTVTAVCSRLGLNRLSKLDPPPPANRYQRRHAGELVHLDIKKIGRFAQPGHRSHGDRARRSQGSGWEWVHVAVDDATRLAYVEVLDHGETPAGTVAFLTRLVAWYAARGITVRAIMTDNGNGYRARDFQAACESLGLRHLRTRPYRPQTNGKAERFIRTLINGWAYGTTYTNSRQRREALPAWLHYYNHHRPHGALDRASPGQRLHTLNNVAGNYN